MQGGEAGPEGEQGSKPDLLLAKTLRFAQSFSITRVTRELALEEHLDRMIDRALRRLGLASDVAPMVAMLASPRSGWITGQVLSISGGFSMV